MSTTTTSPRSLPTTRLTCRMPQIPVGSQTHFDERLCCRSTTADWTYCGEDATDLRWTRRSCNLFRCTVTITNTTPPVQLPLLLCPSHPAFPTTPLPCLSHPSMPTSSAIEQLLTLQCLKKNDSLWLNVGLSLFVHIANWSGKFGTAKVLQTEWTQRKQTQLIYCPARYCTCTMCVCLDCGSQVYAYHMYCMYTYHMSCMLCHLLCHIRHHIIIIIIIICDTMSCHMCLAILASNAW